MNNFMPTNILCFFIEAEKTFDKFKNFHDPKLLKFSYRRNISQHNCSVAQSCLTLCDPMGCSMPGFPVLYHLPEFAQTHVHWVGNALQSSLSSLLLLPSVFPSIKVFSNESAPCIKWPKYWSFSIGPSNEYSELISFRVDWFDLLTSDTSVIS